MNLALRSPDSRATAWAVHGVGAGVLILGAAVAYFLVVAPRHIAFTRNETQRKSLSALMQRASAIRNDFENLREALEEQRSKQKEFQERLPTEPQEAEFLAQAARLARSVDLAIREYRPGKTIQRENYSELEIELSCEGSYESVCRFLAGLPQLPRLSSLTGLELESRAEQSAYPIRLKLSAYFVPMKSEERS